MSKPKYIKNLKKNKKHFFQKLDKTNLKERLAGSKQNYKVNFSNHYHQGNNSYDKSRKFVKTSYIPVKRKRIPSDDVTIINRIYKIKFWINRVILRRWGAGFQDIYSANRRALVRRANSIIALSPYFLNFLREKGIFNFFGNRLPLYIQFKDRWKSKPFSYLNRFYRFMSMPKLRTLRYRNRFRLKTSVKTKMYFRRFLRNRYRWYRLRKKRKKINKLLKTFINLIKINKSGFYSRKKIRLFKYFLNFNLKKSAYRILKQPSLQRLIREHRKYKFLGTQVRLSFSKRLAKQANFFIPILVIQPRLNNLIAYVYNHRRLIFSLSAGMTLRNKGDSRRTSAAQFRLVNAACIRLKQLGINIIDLKIIDNSKWRMLKFYINIFRKKLFSVRFITCAKSIAHNGIRAKKARRL